MAYHIAITMSDPERRGTYGTLCGTVVLRESLTDGTAKHACPKCSAKFMAKYLQENPNGYRLGEREPKNQPGGLGTDCYFKSLYPILTDDGELVGAVAIRGGFDQKWAIYPLTTGLVFGFSRRDTGDGPIPPPTLGGRSANITAYIDRKDDTPYAYESKADDYPSKERALMDVPVLIEDGHLKSVSTILAEDMVSRTQYLAERTAQAAEREVILADIATRKAQREADLETIQIAFGDLLHRPDRGLTNYEKGALSKAASLLGVALPA
jgi:hypothetical protein